MPENRYRMLVVYLCRDDALNRQPRAGDGRRKCCVCRDSFPQGFHGAGVFHHNPDEGGKQNDAGIAASVGILKPFRVWRRISPYAGGIVRFAYLDPTGDNNWLVNLAIGAVIGTEFYVGDRVSLLFQGQLDVGANIFDGLTQVRAATSIAAGGQTGIVFYF